MTEEDNRIRLLEKRLQQKEKIIDVLMKRVEREISEKGSAYDSFVAAAILEKKVNQRTQELSRALQNVERQAAEIEKNWLYQKNLLDNIDDFVAIISSDRKIVFVNRRPLDLAGLQLEEMAGGYFWDTPWFQYPGADLSYIEESIEQAFSGKRTRRDLQVKLGKKLYWIRYKTSPLFDKDRAITDVIAEGVLIDDQKKAEFALIKEKERAQTTLESIGDAVIATDRECRVEYMNPVAEQLTGWRENRAIGQPLEKVFFIINEVTGKAAINPAARCMKEGRIVGLANHTGLVHRDGHTISIEDSAAPIRHEDGEITGAVLVFHDVTQTRSMAKELEFHANHDELTGLINRRQFEERLSHCLQSLRANHADHALFYMDLDQFKVVNDTCGHQAGDELLCLLTALIKPRLRERDTFGRLGGDEFGILLEHCPPDKAFQIANEVRELIEDFRFPWENQIFSLGISIGMVNLMDVWDVEGVDLLKLADTACYAAKDAGRNRVHIYQAEDKDIQQRQGEMNWVSQITRALEEDRFELYFQPIVSVQKRGPAALELLIRMRCDKTGETIPPGAFLPAAERYGLDQKIDRWVIDHALDFFAENNHLLAEFSYCSINVSGNSIGSEEFLRFVQSRFIEKGGAYEKIAFEVTETAAILNLERATQFIRQMGRLGCQFLLDDFGSGMSSFTYLKQLPVNKLKIDGTFVRDIVDDEIDRAMVRSINDVGHAVGMKTVAEFVENEEIINQLALIGVDYAQGYGIAKPRPLKELSGTLLEEASKWVWKAVEPSYSI